ncbi:DNA ligase-like domain-containing protein [Streptomyces rochei]|uniref:hypothetical protein n=1 Tax=Streptomyces rochei TaxID=1928 RepID=UPI003696FF0F
MHLDGTDLAPWPYTRRRNAPENLFADTPLTAPFTLCPSTTDPATARDWLTWSSAGLEGLCCKRLTEPYRAETRAWGRYKVRVTTEAIVGAVTGTTAGPHTLLLGHYDGPALHRPHRPSCPHRNTRLRGSADVGRRRARWCSSGGRCRGRSRRGIRPQNAR